MKTKEEIENIIPKTEYELSYNYDDGFVDGYTQCQEDMAKELEKKTLDELFNAHEPEDFIDENDQNWWEKYKQD